MKFEIKYSNRAVKFLRKLGEIDAKRIFEKIEGLTREPLHRETKKNVGSDSLFRVGVGDFRILYEIGFDNHFIGKANVDRRDKVYQK